MIPYHAKDFSFICPKHFLITLIIFILLYAAVGVIVGMMVMYDSAGEDLGIGQLCKTWAECQSQNAYHIAAGMVIWPLYSIANPLLLAMLVLIGALLYWLMRKPNNRNHP